MKYIVMSKDTAKVCLSHIKSNSADYNRVDMAIRRQNTKMNRHVMLGHLINDLDDCFEKDVMLRCLKEIRDKTYEG